MRVDLQLYAAAHEAAVVFLHPSAGCLRLVGSTRRDFLQRQTTNDLRALKPGLALPTVLSSPTGRILDLLWVFDAGDYLDVYTLPDRGAATGQFLRQRIFFNDDVQIEDRSPERVQIEVFGPRAEEYLLSLGWERQSWPGVLVSQDGLALCLDGVGGIGWRVDVPRQQGDAFLQALHRRGAPQIDAEGYSLCRIEAGIPGVPGELNEAFTPLELGLERTVSLSKGCYTGQEVLARQVNYDRVTRRLRSLQLSRQAAPGTELLADGKRVGQVTSVAYSPHLGWIALGVIRRPWDQAGTLLSLATGGEAQVKREPR